jgi:Tol biopolymer transport system component
MSRLSFAIFSIAILIGCANTKSLTDKNTTIKTDSENVIAYYSPSDKSLYTLTDFKTKKKLITVEDGHITWPIYSPDGKRIAFNGSIDGVVAIYTMDAESGQDLKMVTRPKGNLPEGVLDWHSDGSLICVTKNLDGNAEIYSVFDSTNMKNLSNHEGWDFFPLSHSDDMISFWTTRDDPNKDSMQYDYQSVYTINTDGTNLIKRFQITEMSNKSVGNGIFPTVSPDRKTYVFMMNLDLYSISMDGTNLKNLTQSEGIGEYHPFYREDNSRVFYSSHDTVSQSLNIYSIGIDGNNKEQHTFFNDEKIVILYPKYKPKNAPNIR